MDIWEDVERRIEALGVRTQQRRELLRAIRAHAESGGKLEDFLREEHEQVMAAVESASTNVQDGMRR